MLDVALGPLLCLFPDVSIFLANNEISGLISTDSLINSCTFLGYLSNHLSH